MDFITALKKSNTNGLIYAFSTLSIEMFNKVECLKTLQYPVIRFGKRQTCNVILTGWDILNIEYLSVLNSNDDRQSKDKPPISVLVGLYRNYEDETQREMQQLKGDSNGIFRAILGMTSEQFKYQNLGWIFERLNRNYYILVEGENFPHRVEIDVDAITSEVFGLSAQDYIAVFVILMWLCMQHPDPLSAPEQLYSHKESTVLTMKNLSKLIEYYSCTYQELRTSPLGKQLLYSKPFIQTKRSGYLMSSMFSLAMTLANGLYWLVRDYYKKMGTQKFIDNFGLLFEDYIIDLADRYCKREEWQQLPKTKEKGADFLFSFNSVQMLVEAKSALIQLDTMQQTPNDDAIRKYYDNTIRKAYSQLESSFQRMFSDGNETAIKIILLYDEFSNTAILEESLRDLFYNDPRCFVITIREFEIMLYLHNNDPQMQTVILEQMCRGKQSEQGRVNFGSILQEKHLLDNPHMQNDMDFFTSILEHFRSQF